MLLRSLFLLTSGLSSCVFALSDPGKTLCDSFGIKDIADTAILRTTHFGINATVNITNLFSSISTSSLPAFCRVELIVTTNATAGSFAITEVWLPDDWNGRTLSLGNGGFAGGVNVGDLGLISVRQGFAGISTDTGHNSTSGDITWAGPHNDNAIFDFGFRALHMSVVAGKEVVKQYYGTATRKSYYLGCSTGGRQGLKEVQDFPEDFDGVLGSPANWMTHLAGWSTHHRQVILPDPSQRFIPEDVWINVIAPEALRQCDALDGLVDGIINDPRVCSFRPETLTCRPGQNTSTCLTGAQIFAARHIYADYYEANQTYVFGSYYPGGELMFATTGNVGDGSLDSPDTFHGFLVVNNTNFTSADYNGEILRLSDEIDPGQMNAIKTNITAFAGPPHNGKIIQYVGWADQAISPGNSVHYYETVHTFMQEHTTMEIDDFYRLFPIGGMSHCFPPVQGGPGAGSLGSALDSNLPLSDDPQHNIVAAIVRWVEEGVAPENFTAARYNGGNFTNGLNFTRPVCKYPTSLVFRGGNSSDLNNFECTTLV